MYATGWTISDNLFMGIHGRTQEARGAIFIWHDSRDCVIERNVIVDCDSGICLGNSHKKDETEFHCVRCVVRNNFVTRAPENGILADYTKDCVIAHNTVHDPHSRQRRLIRLAHDNAGLVVANNLLSGPPLANQTASPIQPPAAMWPRTSRPSSPTPRPAIFICAETTANGRGRRRANTAHYT